MRNALIVLLLLSFLVACQDSPFVAPQLLDISQISASAPIVVGGVDLTLGFTSVADTTIDYVRFRAEAYNAVGDRVLDELGRSIGGQYTGPLRPGESWTGTWRAAIYNSSARCFVLTEVNVELQDGGKFTCRGAGLAHIVSASNVCTRQ